MVKGKVFLVGAGPGDPELLTVKAVRLLQQADVVLHDALVSQPIIELVRPGAKVIDIGKRCGQKLLTQDEINSLLVFYARHPSAGRSGAGWVPSASGTVVRLKGGDPCIFGRAGEEIEALLQAGVEFEIVPGITSALAGAAAAGISLTDRRFASSVVFATAHRAPGRDGMEWDKLVTSNSTVVIYMPGKNYAALSGQLRSAGLKDHTPCAVVSCAGRPAQRVLWTDLAGVARASALPAPSLLIVGRCVRALTEMAALRTHADACPAPGNMILSLVETA